MNRKKNSSVNRKRSRALSISSQNCEGPPVWVAKASPQGHWPLSAARLLVILSLTILGNPLLAAGQEFSPRTAERWQEPPTWRSPTATENNSPAARLSATPWETSARDTTQPAQFQRPDPNAPAAEPTAPLGPATFPSEPVLFDPHVRPAALASSKNGSTSSVDAAGGTPAMVATVATKAKAWFGELSNQPWARQIRSFGNQSEAGKIIGSLALVCGLYFAFVWFARKFNLGSSSAVPPEVLEVLGQVPFGNRRNLQLVRLGSKLLLLMNSPEGTQPIGEITDPDEADYLASLCSGNRGIRTSRLRATNGRGSRHRIANSDGRPANEFTGRSNGSRPLESASAQANPNLAEVLRTLETAAKQSRAVFEA